jgi:type II secretory pathway pseudopilin PulG
MLELVVVMAVAATLAAIAVPRFAGSITRSRADAAASRLVADLELARTRARASSRPREVRFAAGTSSYILQGEPTATTPGAAYLVDLAAAPYYARLTNLTLADDPSPGAAVVAAPGTTPARTIVFDAFGTPLRGATIQIAVGDQRRRVSIDPSSGRASVEAPD